MTPGNAAVRGIRRLSWSTTNAAAVVAAVACLVFLAAALLVAVVLPYRTWDAFAFGAWSREMAATGGFHTPGSGMQDMQRPLFYVLQGLLWRAFGFHVVLGRLLSLGFTLVLLGSVALLALRARLGVLGAATAALVCLLIPAVQESLAAGLSDVPAAAMTALVAALYVSLRQERLRVPVLILAAALATLTKTSVLVALGAFVLFDFVAGRGDARARAVRVAPIVGGMAIGVCFFAYEAHRLHLGLYQFLSQVGSYYDLQAARARRDALLRFDVAGADLRLLLFLAIAYTVGRILGATNRVAAVVAAPAAVAAAWLLPAFASGGSLRGPFAGGFGWGAAAFLVLAASLPLAALAGEEQVPSVKTLLRHAVWAAPVVVVWFWHAAYSPRLASPAWPGLVILVTAMIVLVVTGARRLVGPLSLAPMAALIVLLTLAAPRIDGLGTTLWHQFGNAGVGGWRDRERMESLAIGPLQDEVREVARQLGPGDRVLSSDGRLRFFLGPRVDGGYASSCSDLRGHRVFVLLLDPDSTAIMEAQAAGSSQPRFWSGCASPRLTPLREVPGVFAAFAVGTPRVEACDVPPQTGGTVAVFGSRLSLRQAEALQLRAAAVGVKEARVEQTGCSEYSVILAGIPNDAVAREFRAEASAAGFPVTIEHR